MTIEERLSLIGCMSKENIIWLAAMLEGEGSFTVQKNSGNGTPRISISSQDLDVIEKVKALWGDTGEKVLSPEYQNKYGPVKATQYKYTTVITGNPALYTMRLIREHMLSRRQRKIDIILSQYPNGTNRRGRPSIASSMTSSASKWSRMVKS